MALLDTLTTLKVNVDSALAGLKNKVEVGSVAVSRIVTDVYPGDSLEFKIANYDSETAYTLGAALGTVNLVVEGLTAKIVYTAPNGPGNETIQINERQITFPVLARVVVKPTLVSIADGAVDVSLTPTLTTTAFTSTPVGYDTHASTDWQIATDPEFTNIVWSHVDSVGNKETVTVDSGVLSGNTGYYLRVRHVGALLGPSLWSTPTTFTTIDASITGTNTKKFFGTVNDEYDTLGSGVAISGDGAVVAAGAPGAVPPAYMAVYTKSGDNWSTAKLLEPSSIAADGNRFGTAIASSDSGRVLAVGAPDVGIGDNGRVIIYERPAANWLSPTILVPTPSVNGEEYGYSVSITADGATVAAGAPYRNTFGAVVIHKKIDGVWTEQQIIPCPETDASNARFGFAVALSADGTVLAVGARFAHPSSAGAVYIFRHNGTAWQYAEKLSPSTPVYNGEFGVSVSISSDGDAVLVGARNSGVGGSAFVFRFNGTNWDGGVDLAGSPLNAGDRYGHSVSISGDGRTALVGAYFSDIADNNAGATFVFKWNGNAWALTNTLTPLALGNGDYFGLSLAISRDGSAAVIGAGYDDDAGNNAGAAYYYQ